MVPDGRDDDAIAFHDGLLRHALEQIRSPTTTPGQRIAWARVVPYVVTFLPSTDSLLTELLSTAGARLDSPEVVLRIYNAVWRCTRDEVRMLGWLLDLAYRAIRGGHWATFANAAHAAVCLTGFERDLTAEWERAVIAAADDPAARVGVGMFAIRYIARFPPDVERLPPWLLAVRDSGSFAAANTAETAKVNERCPICGMVQ